MAPSLALIKNNRGQGLIEALGLAICLGVFLSILGALLYWSLVYTSISYLLHEHLVCTQTVSSQNCQKSFMTSAKKVMVFSKIKSFHSKSLGSTSKARILIQMPLNKKIQIEKKLSL